jgi:hypothetical protein
MDNKENELINLILELNHKINKKIKLSELMSILLGFISAILCMVTIFKFIDSKPKPNTDYSHIMILICFFGAIAFWQFINVLFIGDIQFPPNELINERDNFIKKVISIKKSRYQRVLKGKDKQKALVIGRDYYKYLRDGELSIYDEAAIKNDLDSMKI